MKEILEEANQLMEKGAVFEYWLLLEKSQAKMGYVEDKVLGEIENGVVIKGKLFLGKNSVIKSGTRIEGNVYIADNCIIGPNAFLRDGTIIDSNSFIGTSEIKNSIVLSNSKIPHFSYVGDSIIGRNCNLGAGTKIANLRHDKNSVKVMINGSKVDSKTKKLGALIFDDVKTGINSSINCGVILEKGS
ncbi:glucose-1-phosphate thymidylyltransferase, partial [archaeon]|nr:glucose-1-phosphate thymidylyltransferase [archaeon]